MAARFALASGFRFRPMDNPIIADTVARRTSVTGSLKRGAVHLQRRGLRACNNAESWEVYPSGSTK